MLGAEIDLRSILALLRRQFWLIVTTFLVVVTLAGLAAFSLTPRYTASALVMVDPSNKNLLEPSLQNFSGNAENARTITPALSRRWNTVAASPTLKLTKLP